MKLSNKMKIQLKKRLASATVIIAVLVLVFACSGNIFVGTKKEMTIAGIENRDSSAVRTAMGNTANIVKDSTGIHVQVEAYESDGVRRIEVLQNDISVQAYNYDGSNSLRSADINVSIPFGGTGNIKVKVNGVIIKNENLENRRYIYSVEDFIAFRDSVNAGNTYSGQIIELVNDIDLSSVCSSTIGSFTPIESFSGEFNGNYHSIKNLYIRTNGKLNVGLFAYNARRNKTIIGC